MICKYTENFTTHKKSTPRSRLVVAGLSSRRRPRFNPSLVRVDFVVHKMNWDSVSSQYFGFFPVSVIPPMLHTYSSMTSATGIMLATDSIVI